MATDNKLTTAAQAASKKLLAKLGTTSSSAGIKERLGELANTKLADTILRTGAKDELLTVDALGVSDVNIINSLSNKLSGFSTEAIDAIRAKAGNLVGDITSIVSSKGGFKLDTKGLTDRVLQSLGGGQGVLRTLSTSLQGSLTQGLGIDPSIYDKVSGTINGVVQSFQSGNINDARGIFDLVNQITGESDLAKFFDLGAQANLLSGLFSEAIRLGIPEAIDALLENSESDEAANAALRGNLQNIIDYSDLTTAATVIERLGANRILADIPTALQQLLANYRFPKGSTKANYPTLYLDLKAVLDAIDPLWGTVKRGSETISDLEIFSRVSTDANTLLSIQPEWEIAVRVAPSYQTRTSLTANLKAKYPYARI